MIYRDNVGKFLNDYEVYLNGKDFSHFILYFLDNPPSYNINYTDIMILLMEAGAYPFNLLSEEEINSPAIANVINNFQTYASLQGCFVRSLTNNQIEMYKAIGCKVYKLKSGITSLNRYIIIRESFGTPKYVPLDLFLKAHDNNLLVGSLNVKDWEEL